MRKDSFARVILERFGELGEITLDAFFPPTYSYTRIWRPLLGLERPPKITRHTVSMNLWRLQKQGLVFKSGGKKTSLWSITSLGKQKLLDQERIAKNKIFKKDGIVRLVIFDIPERERRKRDVLRAELVGCGFQQLQKSVWIGGHALPQDFVRLIHNLGLSQQVHIFSVREKGTLPSTKG